MRRSCRNIYPTGISTSTSGRTTRYYKGHLINHYGDTHGHPWVSELAFRVGVKVRAGVIVSARRAPLQAGGSPPNWSFQHNH